MEDELLDHLRDSNTLEKCLGDLIWVLSREKLLRNVDVQG